MPNVTTLKGLRDLVFMILLYDTGARVQEMLDLRVGDIHTGADEKYVVLTGKGNKTRLVPLMSKIVEHLNEYMKMFYRTSNAAEFMFYVERKGIRGQMSQNNVSKFVKKYGLAAHKIDAEVPEHLYVHMFRHSRAMHLYRNGMPMPLLSEWLGHNQMETTIKYYANADVRMKQEAIEKVTSELNPLLCARSGFAYQDDEETLRKLYGLM